MLAICTVAIEGEADVVVARQRSRRIAALLGFSSQDQTGIATAVSEIARNVVVYAGNGRAEFLLTGTAPLQRLVIRVIDSGPGIVDVDDIMSGRLVRQPGTGFGITGSRRLMDSLAIETSHLGTTLTMEKHLSAHAATITGPMLLDIARVLSHEAAPSPLGELRAQNRELMQSLAELTARQDETDRLNEELEKTNKGVLALYLELDRRAAELNALNATLEARVAAALDARDKIESDLRQSQKMEAVGQLTGGLAHDFNNLLTGIAGSLELLQKRVAQGRFADLDRYVTNAQAAAARAAGLTHRLLAFSRRQTLDPKPLSINCLFVDMEQLILNTVGPMIEVDAVLGADLWITLVDANQLENALLNLCINSRDAMPDGGRLRIETANLSIDAATAIPLDLPPGNYVTLCVTDTGTGMPEAVTSHAFDPFFTTKPIGQGTGLGLSMVYGFSRQSGGQARITSLPGNGTTVCLYLPQYVGDPATEDASRTTGGAESTYRAGKTVLIVDDEPTIRSLITEVLDASGYHTMEAEDGNAALNFLQSGMSIDLLLTDVGLPGGLNGRQLADAARSGRPGLPILFMTGYAETTVFGNRALDKGMHMLIKPFAMHAVVARVEALLGETAE